MIFMKVRNVELLVAALFLSCVAAQQFSAYFDAATHNWSVRSGNALDFVATAIYDDDISRTGWATLDLSTSNAGNHSDVQQAYAAGFLEGYLTSQRITQYTRNSAGKQCDGTMPREVYKWVQMSYDWMTSNVQLCQKSPNALSDCAYWTQVGLVLAQVEGLAAGHQKISNPIDLPKEDLLDLLMLNTNCEWADILVALNKSSPSLTTPGDRGHCSVLVKLTDDYQDLFASHVTWDAYCHMLRVYKNHRFHFSELKQGASVVSFSSTPGYIASGDDYYVTSNGLIVMETTNSVLNKTLYYQLRPQTVPFWVRVTVANRLAITGPQWIELFSKYNSGTYNNQWQIIDTKLFTPGTPPPADTLWIVEQIPGFLQSADLTSELVDKKYFASYNVPYFPYVFNVSDYKKGIDKYGPEWTYENCSRANIFRRDQEKVKTLDDMKHIMRYNQFKTDKFSGGDACNSVSARCDLDNKSLGAAFGGIDCKVTSVTMAKSMITHALSGPTSQDEPAFVWSASRYSSILHDGQPDTYNFTFWAMSPKL